MSQAFTDLLRELRGHPDRGIISALTMAARDVAPDYKATGNLVRILETELFEVNRTWLGEHLLYTSFWRACTGLSAPWYHANNKMRSLLCVVGVFGARNPVQDLENSP